jgi:hypothetical protein
MPHIALFFRQSDKAVLQGFCHIDSMKWAYQC